MSATDGAASEWAEWWEAYRDLEDLSILPGESEAYLSELETALWNIRPLEHDHRDWYATLDAAELDKLHGLIGSRRLDDPLGAPSYFDTL